MTVIEVCSICKKRGVAEGFNLTKLFHLEDNTQVKDITKWCNTCLTDFAKKQTSSNQVIPRLIDTDIQHYNNTYPEVTHFEFYSKQAW